jgi:hypothetical protein
MCKYLSTGCEEFTFPHQIVQERCNLGFRQAWLQAHFRKQPIKNRLFCSNFPFSSTEYFTVSNLCE